MMSRGQVQERSLSPIGDRASGASVQGPLRRSVQAFHLASGPSSQLGAFHAGGRLYAQLSDQHDPTFTGHVDQVYFSFTVPIRTQAATRYLSVAFGTPTAALQDAPSAPPYSQATLPQIVQAAIQRFGIMDTELALRAATVLQSILYLGLQTFKARAS